jgi:hypothetical protein
VVTVDVDVGEARASTCSLKYAISGPKSEAELLSAPNDQSVDDPGVGNDPPMVRSGPVIAL